MDATATPAGSVFVRETPVIGIVAPFVTVTVITVVWPGLRVGFANVLETVGRLTTKSVAFAADWFGIPSSLVTEFAAIVCCTRPALPPRRRP